MLKTRETSKHREIEKPIYLDIQTKSSKNTIFITKIVSYRFWNNEKLLITDTDGFFLRKLPKGWI